MTSAAQKIINDHNQGSSYADCLAEADKLSVDTAQDYEAETTLFEFDDVSALEFSAVDYSIKQI